jgi:hypothetical protein
LKTKPVKYTIIGSRGKLNKIIRDEIKRKSHNKKYNLSGEHTHFDSFNLYTHLKLGYVEPTTKPLIKLNLKAVKTDNNDHNSKLTLKRVNGDSYDTHLVIAIVLATIMAIVASVQILRYGFSGNIVFSILPIFGLIYYYIIDFIANVTFKKLCKKIEKIMTEEGISFQKL